MNRLVASLAILSLAACSVNLDNIPCSNDQQCETGGHCGPDGKCVDGASSCTAPEVLCGTTCTNTNTDSSNCGVCGTACTAPQAGSAMCNSGQCVLTPGMVTNLTAVQTAEQVALAWPKVAGADSYAVARGNAQAGPFASIGTTAVNAYVDHTAATGTTYFYTVTASINGHAGPASAPVSSSPSLAAPQGLIAMAQLSTAVNLSWDTVAAATSYSIARSIDGTTYASAGTSNVNSYTDTQAEPGTKYWYQVSSVAGPITSQPSSAAQVTTPLDPPNSFVTSPDSTSSIFASWQDSANATGYILSISNNNGASFTQYGSQTPTTTSDSIEVTNLSPGTQYQFRLVATNAVAESSPAMATGTVPLQLPSLSLVSSTNTSASFTWTASENATSYQLSRQDSPQGAYNNIGSSTTGLNATDPGPLQAGGSYSYEVTASNSVSSVISLPVPLQITLAAPQNLQTLASSPTQVNLSWSSLGSQVTGYNVEYSNSAGAQWTLAGSGQPTTTGTSFQVGGLAPGTSYLFRVQALAGSLAGSFSSNASAITPLNPATLTQVTAVSSTSISLSWSSSANAANYVINAAVVGGGGLTVVEVASLNYTYTGLQPGTPYIFSVVAVNSIALSATSNSGSATTPLDAPMLTYTNLTASSVTLTWSAPINATNYLVARSSNGGAFMSNPSGTQTNTTATDNTLSAGTTYSYQVTATDAAFTAGTVSNTIQIVFPLAVPTGLSASPTSSSAAMVTWTQVAGATGYNLQRSTNGGQYTPVNSSTPSIGATGTYNDTGVTSGTQVSYQIQSYSGATSGFSSPTTPIVIPLDPPQNVQAMLSSDHSDIFVSWTLNPFASSYSVLRGSGGGQLTPIGTGSGNNDKDTDLQTGATYTYAVVATTSVATSAPSQSVMVTVPLITPFLAIDDSTSTSVSLDWGPASNNPNATGYQVWRQVGTGAFTQFTSTAGSQPTYVDTSLMPATSYSYYVVAVDSATSVSSANSNTVQLETTLDAPTFTTASFTNGTSSISLVWTASANATSYDLQRSVDDGNTWVDLGSQTGTSLTDSSVIPGQQYVYRIDALAAGAMSPFSAITGEIVVGLAATTPTIVSFTSTQVSLSWPAVNGAVGYIVARSDNGGPPNGLTVPPATTTTSYVDTTATPGSQVYYDVAAWTPVTNGPLTATTTITIPIAAPSPVSATGASGNVNVSWGASPGATSYTLQRSINGGSSFTTVSSGSTTLFNDTSALTGPTVYYQVQASAGAILSAYSEPAILYLPISRPGSLTPSTPVSGQIELTWSAVAGVIGYNIFRSTDNATFLQIAETTNTSFIDYSGTPGTTYYYQVQSNSGETVSPLASPFSVSATVTGANPPTGLTATPASFSSITLSWNHVAGSPSNLVLLRFNAAMQLVITQTLGGGTISYLDNTGLSPGETVWYELEAENASGVVSAPTAPLQANTLDLYPPINLALVTGGSGQSVGSNTLSWASQNGITATTYSLFSSPDGFSWAPVTAVTNVSVLSGTDTKASPGAVTYYTATATSGGYQSPFSEVTVVNDLLAAPGTPTLNEATTSSVVLSWPAVTGAEGYNVYRSDPENGSALVGVTSANSFFDTSITGGVTYSYTVAAFTPVATSQPSPGLNNIATTAPANPTPPGNFSVHSVSSSSVTITWTQPGSAVPTGYSLYRATDQYNYTYIGQQIFSSPYTDTNVASGTTYYYKIQANYAGGDQSGFSPFISTTTNTGAPALTAAAGNTQVTLNWTAPVGATSYFVTRATNVDGPFSQIASTSGTDMTDLTASSNTTYYYQVQPFGVVGDPGQLSNEVAATTNTDAVTGSRIITYQNGNTTTTAPLLTAAAGIRAIVPPASAGDDWTVIHGLSSSDGYFTIPNVPQGNFYLHLPDNGNQFSNQRSFDIGFTIAGAPGNVSPTIVPSNVDVDVSGMGNWAPGDLLEIVSLGSGLELYNPQGMPGTLGQINNNATATTLISDLTKVGGSVMNDDDVYFSQLETKNTSSSPSLSYLVATHYVVAHGISSSNGVDQPFGASLSSVTGGASANLILNWKRSKFKTYLAAMNPQAQTASDSIMISTLPGVQTGGFYTGSLDLFMANPPEGTSDLNYGQLAYWSPYLSSWDVYGYLSASATVEFLAPGSTVPYDQIAYLTYMDTLSSFSTNLASGSFGPVITPVQSVTIDGASATDVNSDIGLTPTFTWQAPAVGAASYYQVVIYQLQNNAANNETVVATQFGLTTSATSLTVPSGYLITGLPSIAVITAIYQPTYSSSAPHRGSITTSTADYVSNLFTP